MNIGVIKLGARISFSSQGTSGGTGEALSIIKMLTLGGAKLTIFTKILSKDECPPEHSWVNMILPVEEITERLKSLDALIVINGTVQFYGGAEDREQLLNYVVINEFAGPVFYIYCDPELTLKQVWPSVEKKPWASNWTRQSLEITRKDIIYLSQPYDIEKVLNSFNKNEVVPSKVVHFPFEQFPCLNEKLSFNERPSVDLSYGGTMRGGKREKKMVKFYFGHPSDITVEMFGKIKEDDFNLAKFGSPRSPEFTGPVKYDEMLSKMNSSMSHCVIGDPWYEQINDMAQRAYESIWSSVVTFIDSDLDSLRRVYGKDTVLADFLYVSDRVELSEKIALLKVDTSLRKQIVEDQFKAIGFNAKQYCESFVNLIKTVS